MARVDHFKAVLVPQGKILDYIDETIRKETAEEYVRQEIEKSLIREYGFTRDEIAVEFRVKLGTASKRADLVIFPQGAPHKQEHAWAIIECKAPTVPSLHKTKGVDQLKSYMAACVNAEFGMWTNGQERFCYRKVTENGKVLFVEIPDIPEKGKTIDEAERPSFIGLRPATSDVLLFTFQRCHNYIAGNQGLQKPEAFWELLKLIFCKIEDERSSQIDFYTTSRERQGLNGQLKAKRRIETLFADVRRKYSTIFKSNELVELEPRVLAYIAVTAGVCVDELNRLHEHARGAATWIVDPASVGFQHLDQELDDAARGVEFTTLLPLRVRKTR